MGPTIIAFREHIFAKQPRGAVGFMLFSELLQAAFPLPLRAGRRQTFVGRRTDVPYYLIGGTVENGCYVPFEAPRIPVNGRYQLIFILAGGRPTAPMQPALQLRFAQNMIRDPRVKRLIASARERDMAATNEAMPQPEEEAQSSRRKI